jgi:hypothetical protein
MTDTLIAQLQARNEALTTEAAQARDEARRMADALADAQAECAKLDKVWRDYEGVAKLAEERRDVAVGECERLRAALEEWREWWRTASGDLHVRDVRVASVSRIDAALATPAPRPTLRDEPEPWIASAEDGTRGVQWKHEGRKLCITFCDPPEFYAHGDGLLTEGAVSCGGAFDSIAPVQWLVTGLWPDTPAPTADLAAFRALTERWAAESNDNDTAYNAGWDAAYHECARELLALCAPRSEPRWMAQAFGVIVAWAKGRDDVPAEVDEAIEALRDALPRDAFEHAPRSEPTRAEPRRVMAIDWTCSDCGETQPGSLGGPSFLHRCPAAEDQPQPACPPNPECTRVHPDCPNNIGFHTGFIGCPVHAPHEPKNLAEYQAARRAAERSRHPLRRFETIEEHAARTGDPAPETQRAPVGDVIDDAAAEWGLTTPDLPAEAQRAQSEPPCVYVHCVREDEQGESWMASVVDGENRSVWPTVESAEAVSDEVNRRLDSIATAIAELEAMAAWLDSDYIVVSRDEVRKWQHRALAALKGEA